MYLKKAKYIVMKCRMICEEYLKMKGKNLRKKKKAQIIIHK